MDTEYRLSFSTGDITSPNGNGIIYNMYGMKAFFAQDGNINLMASLLAEQGIKDKMRFDEKGGQLQDQFQAVVHVQSPSEVCRHCG